MRGFGSALVLCALCSQSSASDRVLSRELRLARSTVARFFNQPFKVRFKAIVFKSRSELDAYFMKRWKFKGEPWMVAAGVADAFIILDPATWGTQATEHDGSDLRHVQEIVTHELVHVFHGQHNPSKDFSDVDEIGWFIEGLATFASGQLQHGKNEDALKALNSGLAPRNLATAWSGRYRYGVCGSMVKYIDVVYGRRKLFELLSATTQSQILAELGATEEGFLFDWMTWVLRS